MTSDDFSSCHTIEAFLSELLNVRRALGVGPPPLWEDLKSLSEDLELRTAAGEETVVGNVLLRSGFPRESMTVLMTEEKTEREWLQNGYKSQKKETGNLMMKTWNIIKEQTTIWVN